MCQVTAAVSRILPCKHSPGGQQLLHKYRPWGRVGPSKVRPPGRRKGSPHYISYSQRASPWWVSHPTLCLHPFKRSYNLFSPHAGVHKAPAGAGGEFCSPFARGWVPAWLFPPLPLLLQPWDTVLLNAKLWFLLLDGLSQPWIQDAVMNPPSWDPQVQERPICNGLTILSQKKIRSVSLL